MEEKITTLMLEYGLSRAEINVFSCLVANKELTAYRIAKYLHINRSTCYDVLERLIQKGFASKIISGGSAYFSANSLNRVVSSLKDKENIINALIPELQKLERTNENRISIFEGAEGQKQLSFKLFSLAKGRKISFCYIIGNTHAATVGSNLFIEKLIHESRAGSLHKAVEYKGLWGKRFANDPLLKQYDLLGENRTLSTIPSKVTTVIFYGCLAFLYTAEKSYCIGNTVIGNVAYGYSGSEQYVLNKIVYTVVRSGIANDKLSLCTKGK